MKIHTQTKLAAMVGALMLLSSCGGGTESVANLTPTQNFQNTSVVASTDSAEDRAFLARLQLMPIQDVISSSTSDVRRSSIASTDRSSTLDASLFNIKSASDKLESIGDLAVAQTEILIEEDLIVRDGKVAIEVLSSSSQAMPQLRQHLQAIGFQEAGSNARRAEGWLAKEQLVALAGLPGLLQARAMPKISTLYGDVPNHADVALLADTVRNRYKVDGKGIKIGIISSSFNLQGKMQESVLRGELPGQGNPNGFTKPVQILLEGLSEVFLFRSTDEGRAMAELIHDIAPGAEIVFSGLDGGGPIAMAAAMERLAQAGCDIIVDDVVLGRVSGPWFQDDIASLKIDELRARGVHYFSAAGNYGISTFYESKFKTLPAPPNATSFAFNWSNNPNTAQSFYVIQPRDKTQPWRARVFLQWDEPWPSETSPGASNRLVLFLLDQDNRIIFSSSSVIGAQGALGVQTVEIQPSSTTKLVKVLVLKPNDGKAMPSLLAGYFDLENALWDPRISLNKPTVIGHRNAKSAIAVGASSWYTTPKGAEIWNKDYAGRPSWMGGIIDKVQVPLTAILSYIGAPKVIFRNDDERTTMTTFSSVGGSPILFDNNGNRLEKPDIRQKPTLVAADGSETTFFGKVVKDFPFRFFYGTSAAAPNAAAVGALILQASNKTLTPVALENVLTSTAQEMDNPFANGLQTDPADSLFARGFDYASGYGFLQAEPALHAVRRQMGTEGLTARAICARDGEQVWFINNPNGFGVESSITVQGAALRFEGETGFVIGERTRMIAPQGEFVYTSAMSLSYPVGINLTWNAFPRNTMAMARSTKRGGWPVCS